MNGFARRLGRTIRRDTAGRARQLWRLGFSARRTAVRFAFMGLVYCVCGGPAVTLWAQQEPAAESPSLSSPSHVPAPTVRPLLEAFNYLIDDWRSFQDGDPLAAERRHDWAKFLQRLGRCDAAELSSLARKPTADGWFVGDWQGTAWQLHGRVRNVRRVALGREEAERFGLAEFAVLDLSIDAAGAGQAVAVTARIPASWREESAAEWDEPVKLTGVLMQRDAGGGPVFATQNFAWFPARVQPSRGVSANIVWLARHGVDVAAWQATTPHGTLAYQDRLPFYQLLAAVRSLGSTSDAGRAVTAAESNSTAAAPAAGAGATAEAEAPAVDFDERPRPRSDWDIARWLQHPAEQRGEFYELTGTARRAVAIEVTDPAIRAQLGLSRYYEVEVFVPLPHPLRLVPPRAPAADSIGSVPNEPSRESVPASGAGAGAGAGAEGQGQGQGGQTAGEVAKSWSTYPVVFCCPELPEGFRTGENIHESVRLKGFYFKLWSYHAQATMSGQRTDDSAAAGRQASPLLVGSYLAVVPPLSPGTGRLSTPLVLALFGLLLALLTVVPWYWARSDRAAAQRLRRWRQQHPPGGSDGAAG